MTIIPHRITNSKAVRLTSTNISLSGALIQGYRHSPRIGERQMPLLTQPTQMQSCQVVDSLLLRFYMTSPIFSDHIMYIEHCHAYCYTKTQMVYILFMQILSTFQSLNTMNYQYLANFSIHSFYSQKWFQSQISTDIYYKNKYSIQCSNYVSIYCCSLLHSSVVVVLRIQLVFLFTFVYYRNFFCEQLMLNDNTHPDILHECRHQLPANFKLETIVNQLRVWGLLRV